MSVLLALAFGVAVFILLFFDKDGRVALIVGAIWFCVVSVAYFIWSRRSPVSTTSHDHAHP